MLTIIEYKLKRISQKENLIKNYGNIFTVPDYNDNIMQVYYAKDGETLKEMVKFTLNDMNNITKIQISNEMKQEQQEEIKELVKDEFKLYLKNTKFVTEE